ncbi:MAG: type 4a pilus biogenesis protein PilO [Candidatus Omnitrophica bacterium]|nr:type 4a pilus biogenesis protein PilO [Candidatus Omnitrophota bacterium]
MIDLRNIRGLENLQLDNKKIILIVLISAVLLYVDFSYLLKSQLAGLKGKDSQVINLKKELNNFQKDLKNMQDLKAKQALPSSKQLKAKKIISESQVASLLQDISKLANSNDIRIQQLRPSREAEGKAGKSTVLFIAMELLGDYHHLGKFVNELENAEVFMSVQEIKIRAQDSDPLKQRASLLLKTYVNK